MYYWAIDSTNALRYCIHHTQKFVTLYYSLVYVFTANDFSQSFEKTLCNTEKRASDQGSVSDALLTSAPPLTPTKPRLQKIGDASHWHLKIIFNLELM